MSLLGILIIVFLFSLLVLLFLVERLCFGISVIGLRGRGFLILLRQFGLSIKGFNPLVGLMRKLKALVVCLKLQYMHCCLIKFS